MVRDDGVPLSVFLTDERGRCPALAPMAATQLLEPRRSWILRDLHIACCLKKALGDRAPEGVEPDVGQAVSPVLNGGREETYRIERQITAIGVISRGLLQIASVSQPCLREVSQMPLQETLILFKPGFELFYYYLAALKAMSDADD
jgi:hypothetical protein